MFVKWSARRSRSSSVKCSTGTVTVSTMAKGPRTVLALPDGIAGHWDLAGLEQAVPLDGGYHNLLLRLGDVVLRIEEREPESVAWEHELLAWLAAEISEVIAPIPTA